MRKLILVLTGLVCFSYWSFIVYESGEWSAEIRVAQRFPELIPFPDLSFHQAYWIPQNQILACILIVFICEFFNRKAAIIISLVANLGIFAIFLKWHLETKYFLSVTLELNDSNVASYARDHGIGWFLGGTWCDLALFWFASLLMVWQLVKLVRTTRLSRFLYPPPTP
jgi:hypothetical protein